MNLWGRSDVKVSIRTGTSGEVASNAAGEMSRSARGIEADAVDQMIHAAVGFRRSVTHVIPGTKSIDRHCSGHEIDAW